MVKDGMTVILRGEQEYKISNAISLDCNVTFITGMTLAVTPVHSLVV